MKQKLWIFGDSFADPSNAPTKEFEVWHYQLAEHFEVENFGISGAGPEYSLQQFLDLNDETPNDEKKDINILFLGSQWTRFNFSFFEEASHQVWIMRSSLLNTNYKKFRKFIDSFFTYYVDNNNHNSIQFVLQNMLLVKHYTRHYKKCVYWPVFISIEEEVRELYNSKKFYIVEYKMRDLEILEPFGKGTIPNHMPKESHDIVYQKVMDLFNETF